MSKRQLPKFTGFDHCRTPAEFYMKLDAEFHFDFDPCPLGGEKFFDGLMIEWGKINYVNPPYSNPSPWVMKAQSEVRRGITSVVLLKADTSTYLFHDIILPYASEIRFIKGRLKFPPYGKPAPFASMIVIFKPPEKQNSDDSPYPECPNKKCGFCHN